MHESRLNRAGALFSRKEGDQYLINKFLSVISLGKQNDVNATTGSQLYL